MINEFHGRSFKCATFVPEGSDYLQVSGSNHICSTIGSIPESNVVSGTDYIRLSFNYEVAHLWRNFGIIIAITVFFTATYLLATEFIAAKKSKGEVLIFQRGRRPTVDLQHDIEEPSQMLRAEGGVGGSIQNFAKGVHERIAVFQWKNICFDIKINKKEDRRILDHVDGWVKPGSLTALMVSGYCSSLKSLNESSISLRILKICSLKGFCHSLQSTRLLALCWSLPHFYL
jgi:hypothetical protein